MLNEAVKHLKGELEEEPFTTTIDLNVDAFIPASYIPNEYQKLDIYKRIASIENEAEMEDMLEELIDRFGEAPKKVLQLLNIALLKALAHSVSVVSVEQKGDVIKFVMYEKANVYVERIASMVEEYRGNLKFTVDTNPYFTYKKLSKNKKEKDDDILEVVKNVLNSIKTLLD